MYSYFFYLKSGVFLQKGELHFSIEVKEQLNRKDLRREINVNK